MFCVRWKLNAMHDINNLQNAPFREMIDEDGVIVLDIHEMRVVETAHDETTLEKLPAVLEL